MVAWHPHILKTTIHLPEAPDFLFIRRHEKRVVGGSDVLPSSKADPVVLKDHVGGIW